jgi:hypothetical protein
LDLAVNELFVDTRYYREVQGGVAKRLFVAARQRIFQDFLARMRPSSIDQILDVGVSDVLNDGANILEQCYSIQKNITACGIGAGLAFQRAFPSVQYCQIEPDEALPFKGNSFDIATSNAVMEHLGSSERQSIFVKELCRVARRVFISVPNRFFPVEHHTAIPLAHFQDGTFRLACRITNKAEWALEENLILMTRKRLWRLAAPINRSTAVGYTGLSMGPFSSNLYLAFH